MQYKRNTYLRVYRRKASITQSDLATLLGIEDATNISHFEHGRRVPPLRTIIATAIIFDVSVDRIYPKLYDEVEQEVVRSANSLVPRHKKMRSHRLSFIRSIAEHSDRRRRPTWYGDR